MASGGDDAYYVISFISYAQPDRQSSFFRFAQLLALTTARLFEARPHWGKVCPSPWIQNILAATINTSFSKTDATSGSGV